MTKVSTLVCTATALLLTFGMAMAEDNAQNEQAKPANGAESQPAPAEDQSKPKEVTADPAPTQDNATKSQKEPGCD